MQSEFQSTEEDKTLAMRIKDERCENAFNQLHEKHKRAVYFTCYQQLSNHEDAEDASQEAFASFWENAEQWNGGRVKTYLLSIAKHAAIRLRVHNSRKKRSGEMVYIDEVDADGNQFQLAEPRAEYHAIIENEVELEFDNVLLEMKPTWRLAWILYYREGYAFREVGAIMGGVSKAAAHVWVSEANKVIRKRLWVFYEDLVGDGDPHKIETRATFRNLFTN